MLVLVTYDVNTETAAGRRRLRKVAKVCVDYGQRVQNSVFECLLDAAQYTMFKAKLTELIDSESDSLRFYQLGNHYKSKVEHVGLHPDFDQDGIVCLVRGEGNHKIPGSFAPENMEKTGAERVKYSLACQHEDAIPIKFVSYAQKCPTVLCTFAVALRKESVDRNAIQAGFGIIP